MSWLSNHDLNAALTGMNELYRLRRRSCDELFCQDAQCLHTIMKGQHHFSGVFAVDTLPSVNEIGKEMTCIVNSATSLSKGEHWLAVRVMSDIVEFFDSYGQPPWTYPQLYAWLLALKKRKINFLRQRIQGPKAYCGAYCFYFLSERPFSNSFYDCFFNNPRFIFTAIDSGETNEEMIKTYLSVNDRMVFDYLFRHVKQIVSVFEK